MKFVSYVCIGNVAKLINIKMQENAREFEPIFLQNIFTGAIVKTNGQVSKVTIDVLNGKDLKQLTDLYSECGIDLFLKRSDKGIKIIITRHPDGYVRENSSDPKLIFKTVRDFYELVLPQDARIAAFENTATIKLDRSANNLWDAIMQSFYIADTPQGANYWQDVILECLN